MFVSDQTPIPSKLMLNVAYATLYDLQKQRQALGNRLVASFRSKLGMAPSEAEANQDDDIKKVFDIVRKDYNKITEGVVGVTGADGSIKVPTARRFKPQGCITTVAEFSLIHYYISLKEQEQEHMNKLLPNTLKGFIIYEYYLKHVRGIGPAMAAALVRYMDIKKARYPSSFVCYIGLDVVHTRDVATDKMVGRGRGRYKDHLVPRQYTSAAGEQRDTMGVSFNPFLKTKLVGVLGGSFLKCNSPYAEIYNNYKTRLENHPKYSQVSKGHRHNMALRYMVKQFIIDLFVNWRIILGLPRIPTYEEAKLGIIHGGGTTRPPLTGPVLPSDWVYPGRFVDHLDELQ